MDKFNFIVTIAGGILAIYGLIDLIMKGYKAIENRNKVDISITESIYRPFNEDLPNLYEHLFTIKNVSELMNIMITSIEVFDLSTSEKIETFTNKKVDDMYQRKVNESNRPIGPFDTFIITANVSTWRLNHSVDLPIKDPTYLSKNETEDFMFNSIGYYEQVKIIVSYKDQSKKNGKVKSKTVIKNFYSSE